MTKDEISRSVIQYRDTLINNPDFEYQHIISMIPKMLVMEDVEKLMRWLGFIQGVLWAKQLYTLEELKSHNKGTKNA